MYIVKKINDGKWVVMAGKYEMESFATEYAANHYADYMTRTDREDNGR